MLIVERPLGNRHEDPQLEKRCEAAEHQGRLETLLLRLDVAQRRRLRMLTDAGTDVGISLQEGDRLKDGDVLLDEEAGRIVVVALEAEQVVSFALDPSLTADDAYASGVKLGHLLGMQHWNFRWIEGRCTVAVSDRRMVEPVLRAHPVEGVTYEFSPSPPGAGG